MLALNTGPLYPPGERLIRQQDHYAYGRIKSVKISRTPSGIEPSDLPACGAVLRPTVLPRNCPSSKCCVLTMRLGRNVFTLGLTSDHNAVEEAMSARCSLSEKLRPPLPPPALQIDDTFQYKVKSHLGQCVSMN
jgi:hypothetical protein